MKVIDGPGRPRLALVCGVHGDERFGVRVWRQYAPQAARIAGLRLILANERAVERNQRFIETDLNRSFPGKASGSHEERLAARLAPLLQASELVVDLHTTTSDIAGLLITTELSPGVKRIINATDIEHIAEMGPAPYSLIGAAPAGLSVELGPGYARTAVALGVVERLIDRLLAGETRAKRSRHVYRSIKTIPLGVTVPSGVRDLHYSRGLQGYPLLLHEKAYQKEHQGFLAQSQEVASI